MAPKPFPCLLQGVSPAADLQEMYNKAGPERATMQRGSQPHCAHIVLH